MKLIQRITLGFKSGSSDKVYIVELHQAGNNRFLVNFEYGRRGQTLQTGTKTASPVSERQARSIFDRLVDEKKRKGYTESKSGGAAPAAGAAPKSSPKFASREAAILARLTKSEKSKVMARAAWRAGELRLAAAAPALANLVGAGSSTAEYAVLWGLARVADAGTLEILARNQGKRPGELPATADDAVSTFFPKTDKSPTLQRVALEVLRAADPSSKALVVAGALQSLPAGLRALSESGTPQGFSQALAQHLMADSADAYAALEHLYRVDSPIVRPGLLAALKAVPLRPPAFRTVRHLFKIAELRGDAEVFGLLGHRFETTNAMFHYPRWGDRIYLGGQRIQIKAELGKDTARLAYSSKTRRFLRDRVTRTLRRLGEASQTEFVRLAVGVLLPFTDADAKPVQSKSRYSYSSRKRVTTYWDAYGGYQAFNFLLYAHSKRYEKRPGTVAWRCTDKYKPGEPAPPTREEAFPKLWDEVPVGLLHLLSESLCARVHEFASKALRANKEFCDELDIDTISMLLRRPYEVTAQLGFELAQSRYRPQAPDLGLLLAMALAAYAPARTQAWAWIDEARLLVMGAADLLAALVVAPHADSRQNARRFLESTNLSPKVAEEVIARAIASILHFDDPTVHGELAREAGDTLLRAFARPLRTIGLTVIADLIAHPLETVQELGARLLLGHQSPPRERPQELLAIILRSPFPTVRGLGARLLGELDDEALSRREALLVDLILSPHSDLRDAIRPVIARVAGHDDRFASELSRLLIAALMAPEAQEGMHSHILRVLRGELLPSLKEVPKDVVLRLLKAKSPHAQELGGYLLQSNVDTAELSVAEVARLASHEILSVREAAWKFYSEQIARIKAELGVAIRIVDAKWEDSRAFAFDLMRERFTEDDLTPEVLVGLCDSVRPDVQKFGQEMITRFFRESQGQDYLLRLSEHPSASLQLFASAFLERYAAGDLGRLRSLQPYFLGVLSRVNRGRVAKARVLDFLTQEAIASEETAIFVAELLIRISLTIAIGDRAACIASLLAIHKAYPDLDVALAVRTPPLRGHLREVRDGV
ncbi:MAG: WGR domain-containing protein [Nannocystaceae bacterium]